MDIWSRNGDRMGLVETESSEIFFFFSFISLLSFLFLHNENENGTSYWKEKLFRSRISEFRLFRSQAQVSNSQSYE